jgi:hypothetical protein
MSLYLLDLTVCASSSEDDVDCLSEDERNRMDPTEETTRNDNRIFLHEFVVMFFASFLDLDPPVRLELSLG